MICFGGCFRDWIIGFDAKSARQSGQVQEIAAALLSGCGANDDSREIAKIEDQIAKTQATVERADKDRESLNATVVAGQQEIASLQATAEALRRDHPGQVDGDLQVPSVDHGSRGIGAGRGMSESTDILFVIGISTVEPYTKEVPGRRGYWRQWERNADLDNAKLVYRMDKDELIFSLPLLEDLQAQ